MPEEQGAGTIRPCEAADTAAILSIINAGAEAYRGVIPADRWHEPYMSAEELAAELADGVVFSGCVVDDQLVGVMGTQRRSNVDLIRHAYVLPAWRGRGIGSQLLKHLRASANRTILIGTWADADRAIRFYQRHGFALVERAAVPSLLQTYWNVPERQVETSVVLASPVVTPARAQALIAEVSGSVQP